MTTNAHNGLREAAKDPSGGHLVGAHMAELICMYIGAHRIDFKSARMVMWSWQE